MRCVVAQAPRSTRHSPPSVTKQRRHWTAPMYVMLFDGLHLALREDSASTGMLTSHKKTIGITQGRPVLRVLTSCALSGLATRGGRAGSCPPCIPRASPDRGSSSGGPAVSGRPGPGVWSGLCPHATEPGHVPRTSSEHGTGAGLVPHFHMLDTQLRIISETPAIVATREQQSTTTSARACMPTKGL